MFDDFDQKDRNESELVRLTTARKKNCAIDLMIWALKLLDVVLSELRSGEPDLDHVFCGGQRGNEAVHVPKSLRTLASRARAGMGRGNVT